MPTYTPNLNLEKPIPAIDNVRVQVINDNMDKLDTAVTEKLKIADKATQFDAEAGTDDTKYMTPLSTKQAVIKFAPELEYKDVTNLSATTAGVITWGLPIAIDQTRTAIMLCRATKDISNMDYVSCLADSGVTKNTLGKDVVTNTYTGLVNNTQYWVKVFVEYVIGGENYYSNGSNVTFTTPNYTVLDYYDNGNEFISDTGGWGIGISAGTGSQTKANNALELTLTSNNSYRTYVTANKIDFTNIKTIKIEWENLGGSNSNNALSLTDDKVNYIPIAEVAKASAFSRQISTLDVTNITGFYHLWFRLGLSTGTGGTLKGFKIWGES